MRQYYYTAFLSCWPGTLRTVGVVKYYSCDLHEVSSLALCYGFSHKFDKGKKGFRFLHEMSIIKNTLPPTGKRISCYRYRYKECGKAFSSAVEISCFLSSYY